MQYNSSKLTNGLSIVTCNMPSFRSTAINIIVNVGSRKESISENGISHFLEHMAFKGTSSRSAKEIAEEFDNIGGQFNGYTSREQTVYHAKILSEYTEKAIAILADILQNSLFYQEDIDKECQVIVQEIAAMNDNPDDLAYEKLLEVCYQDQSIGRSVLGTVENISKFKKEDFTSYIDKHYSAENIVISMAGNIDHNLAVNLAYKYFNSISSGTQLNLEPGIYQKGFSLIEKDLEQLSFFLAFETVPYTDIKSFYEAQIMSIIFGGGISSRLFQEVRENRGLVYSIGSFMNSYYDTGLFAIHAGTSKEKLYELAKIINEEITKLCSYITYEELQRAKVQIRSSLIMAEEKPSYKSDEIGKNFSILGRFMHIDEILSMVNATTISDIKRIAEKTFNTHPSLSIVGNNINNVSYESIIKA